MEQLTHRQKSILDVICVYYQRWGFSPTVREICDQLGLAGPAGVHRILRVLQEKGYIESTPRKNRSWRPVGWNASYSMPISGRIAAGEPLDVWDNPDERIPVDPLFYGDENCFALRVSGDSMTGVHITDGDLAIIRPQPNVDSGEIAAVMVEGVLLEATLKIVRKEWNVLELHSANDAYPPMRFLGGADVKT